MITPVGKKAAFILGVKRRTIFHLRDRIQTPPSAAGGFDEPPAAPPQRKKGEVPEAALREENMEFKGERDAILKQDLELQSALNGDQEALGRLLVSCMPQLYRAALRILRTPQDAEEALQDGLLQVVKHFREFEGRSRFSTWVTQIVINAALMRLRQSRPAVLISIDRSSIDRELGRDEPTLACTIPDPAPNPEERYVWKERLQLFGRKLWNLPGGYRSVLWLRDVQGVSTKEAAKILGVKASTLKSQLYRARRKLGTESCTASPGRRTLRTTRGESGTSGRRLTARLMIESPSPVG
jgi:RNA polymerase sigma-70 factor (ECF subfamily)